MTFSTAYSLFSAYSAYVHPLSSLYFILDRLSDIILQLSFFLFTFCLDSRLAGSVGCCIL